MNLRSVELSPLTDPVLNISNRQQQRPTMDVATPDTASIFCSGGE